MRKSTRSERIVASVPGAVSASTDPKRRRFLLALGASSAAAASVAAVPGVAAEPQPTQDNDDGRYSETRHVRDYYRTTRI